MNSQEWTAKPDEQIMIPPQYLDKLSYEIIILSAKKLMTFQCASYELKGQVCIFHNVILDTSEKNARGKVMLQRVSYHEEIILGNTGFMAIPIPEPSASAIPGS